MKTQNFKSRRGSITILLWDDGKVVQPVWKFLHYLYNINSSPYTITSYCFHLKLYYEYLNKINMTIDDVYKETDDYSPADHFGGFIMYLQYPKYFDGIRTVYGEEPAREKSSINTILAAVFSYYDFLARENKLKGLDIYKEYQATGRFNQHFLMGMQTNVATYKKNVFKLKEPIKRIKYLTTEEFKKILNAATCLRDKCILCIGFYGGLRIGEILNLRISDIVFWENKINIVPRECNINGSRVKNYAAGSVFVPNELMRMLVKYVAEVEKFHSDYLFINLRGKTKGKPMNCNNIEKIFDNLSERSGIHVHPHMLRHSFAVHRISTQGVNYGLPALKKDMRHRNIESTMIYAEFLNEAQEEITRQYFEAIGKDYSPGNIDFYDEIGRGLLDEE